MMNVRESQSFTCIALRQSKKDFEIVPQEACVQHKGPETILQELQARERTTTVNTSTDPRQTNDLRRPSVRDQKRLSVT